MDQETKTEEAIVQERVEAIVEELDLEMPECEVTKEGDNFLIHCENKEGSFNFLVELREEGSLFILKYREKDHEDWTECNENFATVLERS